MTPKFAQAVDPVLLHVLGLLERVARDERPSPQEERLQITALLDQAEAIVGVGQEWELGKYALVSWIDEVLLETPWEGREWWNNNVLEVETFNTRLCNERFYTRAQEASTLPRRDALEVYYVCVVLGFRGLYREPELAAMLTESNGLPDTLDGWARQTALAIRLGQGRPALAGPRSEVQGAPPLRSQPLVLWSWLTATLLAAVVTIYYTLVYRQT
ncbi:MAG: DotU family type IV/VI secretion system protein [Planctomycetia bacterium]|nr:DotU family type IV/VI secretion system protein [Planctomycetia bacterium]